VHDAFVFPASPAVDKLSLEISPQYVYPVNAVVLLNALVPIDDTPTGIVSEVIAVPLNASLSIVLRVLGKFIEVSAVADSKVFCRTAVTPSGIVMEVKAALL
jgi:hypothetical protein